MLVSKQIELAVKSEIYDVSQSRLGSIISNCGPFVIKFVQSRWAAAYERPRALKVSETPALTWGTATYVTPICFPLSSALYGRVGLVTDYDPSGWRVFDATSAAGKVAYVRWARSQPMYADLLLTVHSTQANHLLRDQFRSQFRIDCVLFNPDQEAEIHTDRTNHIWMAVTDWTANGSIEHGFSTRLANARFTVLIDEDFQLQDQGLPIRIANRQIESITERLHAATPNRPARVPQARLDPTLPANIAQIYRNGGYLHVYIEP